LKYKTHRNIHPCEILKILPQQLEILLSSRMLCHIRLAYPDNNRGRKRPRLHDVSRTKTIFSSTITLTIWTKAIFSSTITLTIWTKAIFSSTITLTIWLPSFSASR